MAPRSRGWLLALLLAAPLSAVAAPFTPPPSAPPPSGLPSSPAPSTPASSSPATSLPQPAEATDREQQLLERIRELKAPRLRTYGACRYDWSAWRLNDRGVRSTASDCGDPPIRGTVAVYCDTLQINRRVEEGPWEGWRLPYSDQESPLLGGEDRLVASLCANVRQAGRGVRGEGAPTMGAPAKLATPAKPMTPAKPASPLKPVKPAKAPVP